MGMGLRVEITSRTLRSIRVGSRTDWVAGAGSRLNSVVRQTSPWIGGLLQAKAPVWGSRWACALARDPQANIILMRKVPRAEPNRNLYIC